LNLSWKARCAQILILFPHSRFLFSCCAAGKTLCLANRITLEAGTHKSNPSFKQLFVARSSKICKHVKALVGPDNGAKCGYFPFAKFLDTCGAIVGEGKEMQKKRNNVDFKRYKHEFYRPTKETPLDPLVIWTQIRSFIKGSIETVKKGQPLSKDDYMNLGEKKCRLTSEQVSRLTGLKSLYGSAELGL